MGERLGSAAAAAGDAEDRGWRPRWVRPLAAAAVLAGVAALTAVLLLGSGSRPAKSGGARVPPGQTTSVVARRTLTESSTVEGTLGYGAELELYNRVAGTFTWLPSVGDVIGRGGTLWRIDNRPVTLMYGPVPAYRALKEGVHDGPDVAELNRNLIDLGFDPYGEITVDRHYGAATAAAVRRWQEADHLPETGEVELGRIVLAPGARRVTALDVVVGQDPPAIGEGEEAANEKPGTEEPAEEEPDAKPTGEEPAAEGPTAEEEPAEEEAAEEEAKNPGKGEGKEPSGEEAAEEEAAEETPAPENGSPGSGSAAAEPVLGTTATRQLVQLKVDASEQELARVGESAPVALPDGEVVKGHITGVGTVAEAVEGGGPGEEGGGEEPTISVTLALDHPVARLDAAPVSVELVKQVRRHVLTVPATALLATAGGGYAVEALRGGRRVELPVTPGMFADGYVQIEGHGVHAGLKVTEPAE